MDMLENMRLFVRVVEAGSFTAVAKEIDATTAQVSRAVSNLEAHVQTRLLHRTTRHLGLTESGERYFERAKSILAEFDYANAEARNALLRPFADHDRRQRPADDALRAGEGVDEDIRSLQVAQHADIEEIGGVWAGVDLVEIAVVDAIVDALRMGAGAPDLLLIDAALEIADEDDRVFRRCPDLRGR